MISSVTCVKVPGGFMVVSPRYSIIFHVQFLLRWLQIYGPYLAQILCVYSFLRFVIVSSWWYIIKVNISYKLLPLISKRWTWCVIQSRFQIFHAIMILIPIHLRLIVVCIYYCIIIITFYIYSCVVITPQILSCVRMSFSDCTLEIAISGSFTYYITYPISCQKLRHFYHHFLHIITYLCNCNIHRCV